MAEMRNAYKILFRKPEGKNHSEDLGVDGMVILKWMLGKQGWRVWTVIGFWTETGDGLLCTQ
jgi:hypothetical protein